MSNTVKTVSCPTCNKQVQWRDENAFRPFCSERCRLIDFGDWAAEKNTIPGEPVFPAEDGADEESLQ